LQEKKFFTKLKTSHEEVGTRRRLANHLGASQFAVWLGVQNVRQKDRGILNPVLFSWARVADSRIANDGKHLEQLLCFYSQLQFFYFVV
jgi:hypothetical protein